MNTYQYAYNNPTRYIDPMGLAPGDWWDPIVHPIDFYRYADEVRRQSRRVFGDDSNARHYHASDVLAFEYGPNWARLAGAGNEVQGFLRWDLMRLSSRLRGNSPWAFQLEDLTANEAGIQEVLSHIAQMSYQQLHIVWGMVEAYPFSRQIAFGVGCRHAPNRSAADGDPHRVPLRIALGVARVIGRHRESGRIDIGRAVDIGCASFAGADAHPRRGRNPHLPRG